MAQGLLGYRVVTMSRMPWSPTPRWRRHPHPFGCRRVDFRWFKSVVPPVVKVYGAQSLQPVAYGLRACWPTFKVEDCSPPSKV